MTEPEYDPDNPRGLPPELMPETEADHERRRRSMWLGIGIPIAMCGVLAVLLGVPWWIVLLVVVGVGVGIFLST
jgi:hypothetical protein